MLSLRKKLALEIWRKREQNLRREHPLEQLFWECTLRCNLHCRHCGSDCKAVAQQQDMPKEDFLRVLDSIAAKTDPHKVFVIISGGEPLMRDDLEACGRAIYERGFPWGMVTNGLALTPQRFNALMHAGMRSMTLSLDGLEEDHNWMRGNKLSFQMVDRSLRLLALAKEHLVYDVVTCVTQRNYPQLSQIRDYLISKDVPRWRLFTVFPVGRAAADPQMRLSRDQLRGLYEFIKSTRREKRIRADFGCEGFLGEYEAEVRDHFFSCQAGITIGSVLADGSIGACSSIRADFHQGNIYEDDFMDVWENRFQLYRNREWARQGECADCSFFRYCQGNGMHLHAADGQLLFCNLKAMA